MNHKNSHEHLIAGLGLKESISIVMGTIIGTGIFLKAAIMTVTLESPTLALLAWVVAGLLSLAGALTYAELGSLFPKAGGEYIYLKEAYGNTLSFLYGWMRFWIGSPGSIAAYAVGSATFMNLIFKFEGPYTITGVAIVLILLFSGLNCLTVMFSGKLSVIMTTLKVLIIFTLIYGALFLSQKVEAENLIHWSMVSSQWKGWSFFGTAVLAALWAFDGWNNLPMMASEVKKSSKNVPLALIIGVLSVLFIYILINYSYFYALPINEILTSNSKMAPTALPVATKVAQTFLGDLGTLFLSVAMTISAVGAMNSSILTSSRVPYAMAKDKLFFPQLSHLSASTKSPIYAIMAQAMIAILLALSGTFDQLTDYVVFSAWLFYALAGLSLFIFRKKIPHAHRNYKVWGYPFIPILFVTCSLLLLINTIATSPKESLVGLFIIAAGYPFYKLFFKSNA